MPIWYRRIKISLSGAIEPYTVVLPIEDFGQIQDLVLGEPTAVQILEMRAHGPWLVAVACALLLAAIGTAIQASAPKCVAVASQTTEYHAQISS